MISSKTTIESLSHLQGRLYMINIIRRRMISYNKKKNERKSDYCEKEGKEWKWGGLYGLTESYEILPNGGIRIER